MTYSGGNNGTSWISVHHESFATERVQRTLRRLRTCLWLYIVLVFLEGPLRKWIVPQASIALLIARDPVVLTATFYGLRLGLFRNDRFLAVVSWLGVASVVVSLLVGGSLFATLYGWRTDFFHVPIAVLIARVFTRQDLERLSWGLLALALPMALLMVVQFYSPPNSWINAGLDEQFKQIGGLSENKIRPPGTFSFATGPAAYFPLVLASLLGRKSGGSSNQLPLQTSATIGIVVGTVFSGSRTLWSSEIIVFLVYVLASARYRRQEFARQIPALIGLSFCIFYFTSIPAVAHALQIFESSRLNNGQDEFLGRVLATFIKPINLAYDMPLFGYGLGIGTSIGSQLQGVGSWYAYGDAETETLRHFIESGLWLGGLYALLRTGLTLLMLFKCLVSARRRDLRALLFWAAAAPLVLNGQIGQSTNLGMAILGSSLCLASARFSYENQSRYA